MAHDTRVIQMGRQLPTKTFDPLLGKFNFEVFSPAYPVSITSDGQLYNPNSTFPTDVIFAPGYPADWTIHIGGHFELSPNDLGVPWSGHSYISFLNPSLQSPDFGASVASNTGPVPVSVDWAFSTEFDVGNIDLVSATLDTFTNFWTVPDGYFVYYIPDITIVGKNPRLPTSDSPVDAAIPISAAKIRTANKIETIKAPKQSVTASPVCD